MNLERLNNKSNLVYPLNIVGLGLIGYTMYQGAKNIIGLNADAQNPNYVLGAHEKKVFMYTMATLYETIHLISLNDNLRRK